MESIRKPRRVALFVGVDEYRDSTIPHLNGAVADAKALHGFFSSRKNQFDVAELLENPTSDDVLDKVESLSSDLGEGDLFMFYFAGHGMDDGGKQKLLCSNTRQGRRSLANEFDLRNVAGDEKWNVAVILDACRTRLDGSRGVGDRVGDRRDIDFYDALVQSRRPEDASLTVLFSCDEGKTAGEVKGRNHGLFTLALLDVLERADKEGKPWCFDQNLGDEIGRTMRRLADSDSGQRPWIKASGTPPLFFLPSLDLKPLVEWTRNLQDAGFLSLGEAAECQRALGATSPSPCAKGLFEAIRFFSLWRESRKTEATPDESAAIIIKALCGGINAAPIAYGIPATAVPEKTGERFDAEDGRPPRPLSGMEMRRLRETAAAAIGRWCAEEPMRPALDRMASAQTDADAMSAIRSAETAVRDAFVRENCIESGMGAGSARRLPPLFSTKTWETLRQEIFRLPAPSDVDAALRSFFGVVGACCRLR